MTSIAAVSNVYNDAHALRGMLENASMFFDEIFIIHSGPNNKFSNDGTIELCEKFGVKLRFDDMNEGFGVIRTKLIHGHGCEWGMILDADERFYPMIPQYACVGSEKWSVDDKDKAPMLSVTDSGQISCQGDWLRNIIAHPEIMAVKTSRRHWLDFSFKKPTQNWFLEPDWQLRIVRNDPNLVYRSEVKMHERIIDLRTGNEPLHVSSDKIEEQIFHDHFHPFFRNAYPGKKESNENYYKELEKQ